MKTRAMRSNYLCKNGDYKKSHKIVGAVIAIVGFFWFAKKIGWIPVAAGGSVILGPAVTIAIGVAIFLSASRNHKKEN